MRSRAIMKREGAVILTDANMLLSFINTKLRDEYATLEALCEDLELSQEELISRLAAIGYGYAQESNRFVPIS